MKKKFVKKGNQVLVLLIIYVIASCSKEQSPQPVSEVDADALLNGVTICANQMYEPSESSEYVLPYPVGDKYTVNLSHCGGSYHSAGQPDQYAIDFAMNVGSIITASRPGKVVFVEESGFDGGFPNNLVVVQHADGTYSQYMHLTHNGAEVITGETVERGDTIGISGSTGLAGYPHLHFVATKSGSWRYPYISFPTTFSNTTNNPRSLEEGKIYEAEQY